MLLLKVYTFRFHIQCFLKLIASPLKLFILLGRGCSEEVLAFTLLGIMR